MTTSQSGLEDFEEVGRYVTATIQELNPDYADLDDAVVADVITTNIQNASVYFGAVLRQRRPDPREFRELADAARRRVHQGIRLESVLRAYRIGARAMWEKLSETRPDLDHRMLTDWTLRYIDWVSSEAERAYLAERDGMLNSHLEEARLLIARLIEDDFGCDADREAAYHASGSTRSSLTLSWSSARPPRREYPLIARCWSSSGCCRSARRSHSKAIRQK